MVLLPSAARVAAVRDAVRSLARARPVLLLLLGLLLAVPAGQAHLLNMSRVEVALEPGQRVVVTLRLDLSRPLGGPEAYYAASRAAEPLAEPRLAKLAEAVARATEVRAGGVRVPLAPVTLVMPDAPRAHFVSTLQWPRAELRLAGRLPAGARPEGAGLQAVFVPTFRFEEPIAVTLRDPFAERSKTRWLVAEQPSPVLKAPGWFASPLVAGKDPVEPTVATGHLAALVEYAALGFCHILPGGYDHLLFVLALLLGATGIGRLAALLAMYTLAHSVTLALATLRWVEVPAAVVEPVIALSIAWVGIENWRGRGAAPTRFAAVFAFGLVHGLGFSGALTGMELPHATLLAALIGFNVGVELGQLAFVALLVLVFGALRGLPWYHQRVVRPASTAITLLALYWTAQRTGLVWPGMPG